ncbi:Hypothetical predicted protein [Cloeon dipterum]|nr:Hypothetical predicted protein [Cloeon dipterum]
MPLCKVSFLIIIVNASIAFQVCRAVPPVNRDRNPLRYDLLRSLPLKSTPKPYPAMEVGLVRPVERFFDLIRTRMALRRKLNPSLPNFAARMSEGERSTRVQRAFDNVSNFVHLVGDIDSFLADRARSVVRRLNAMFSEEDRYRREMGQ